jgi:ABC-type Mn2+/Zn2+ transport system permease subunit
MMLAAKGTEQAAVDGDQWILIRTLIALSGAAFYGVWGLSVRLPRVGAAASGLGFFLLTGVVLAFIEDPLAWFGVLFCLTTGLCVSIGVRAMRRR